MENMKTIKQLKRQQRLGITPAKQSANVNQSVAPTSPGVATQTETAETATAINAQVQQLAQELANQIIAEQQQLQVLASNGRTFTKFDTVNDIIDNQTETVTAGVFSGNVASLTTFFTSSAQTISQKRYYVDTFDGDPSVTGSAVQFALAYGNALGSGSSNLGNSDSPSKAVYGQYRQLLLNPTDTRFTTAGSGSTDSIYVINFKRNRLKERLDSGNFEIALAAMSASADTNATGSNVAATGSSPAIQLIDDSSIASATTTDSGKVFNIVSGSITSGVFNSSAPIYYGLSYPDYGTLVLDGKMLDQHLDFQTNTGSNSEGNNHYRLFHSISGSAALQSLGFQARNSEKIASTHYFVRIKNAEYNFSNNPSYVTGSDGLIKESTFIGDPKVYITTVGLYNNAQELLAVAKLSKPLLKSFQREALIRVKLDF
jgi:hypothetical protein